MREISFLTTLVVAALFIIILPRLSTTTKPALYTYLRLPHVVYEAPMLCPASDEVLVPGIYFVFLHQGFSLEKHKQTVGVSVDLDSAISYAISSRKVLSTEYITARSSTTRL